MNTLLRKKWYEIRRKKMIIFTYKRGLVVLNPKSSYMFGDKSWYSTRKCEEFWKECENLLLFEVWKVGQS